MTDAVLELVEAGDATGLDRLLSEEALLRCRL
jgi:hypothetical protein